MIQDYQHKVQYYETDRMGITHHSVYIRWLEEARNEALSKSGWDYDSLEKEGIVSPVVSVSIKYKEATTFPEIVTIRMRPEPFNGIRLKLDYTIFKADGTVAATAETEHCFLDADRRIINVRRSLPELYRWVNGEAAEAFSGDNRISS